MAQSYGISHIVWPSSTPSQSALTSITCHTCVSSSIRQRQISYVFRDLID